MEKNSISTPSQDTPEVQPAPVEEAFPTKPKSSNKWLFIVGGMVVFLAAAVFLGARLLNPQARGLNGGGMFFSSKGGPGGAKSIRISGIRSKELPPSDPDASGLFVRREDQSIFIGTGNVRIAVNKSMGGGPGDISSDYDGPVVEVVVNHQTKIYQDVTEIPEPDQATSAEIKVQQVVKPGLLKDLGSNTLVTAWGDRQGDRYIAKVIVYR